MGVYRYVGAAPAEIMDSPYSFKSFGQLVEIPDTLAEHAISHRIPIVPIVIWEEVGITDSEAKRHARFESHAEVSPEFAAKRDAIWRKSNEHREAVVAKMNAPVAPAEGVTNV